MKRSLILWRALSLLVPASARGQATGVAIAEDVRKGRDCRVDSMDQVECVYTIGKSLVVTIVGVGLDGAAIHVDKSEGMAGDYYFTFGLSHGCVVIKPGRSHPKGASALAGGFAFISPWTGEVYDNWRSCKAANPRMP